jgi:hypothetical protein
MPAPEQIARLVLDHYATCTTYSDRGRQVSIRNPDGPPRSRNYSTIHFETRLERPDRFFFEYLDEAVGPRESWPRYIIVQDAGKCRQWWSIRPDETDRDLRRGLAGATGVSSGTASTIPALLLPGVVDRVPVIVPAECERLEDADIDGTSHWCLRGNPARFPHDRLYIDPSTLLIRRFTDRSEIDARTRREILEASKRYLSAEAIAEFETGSASMTHTSVTVRQTDYTAAFDTALPADAFRFDPG